MGIDACISDMWPTSVSDSSMIFLLHSGGHAVEQAWSRALIPSGCLSVSSHDDVRCVLSDPCFCFGLQVATSFCFCEVSHPVSFFFICAFQVAGVKTMSIEMCGLTVAPNLNLLTGSSAGLFCMLIGVTATDRWLAFVAQFSG